MDVSLQGINPKLRHKLLTLTSTAVTSVVNGPRQQEQQIAMVVEEDALLDGGQLGVYDEGGVVVGEQEEGGVVQMQVEPSEEQIGQQQQIHQGGGEERHENGHTDPTTDAPPPPDTTKPSIITVTPADLLEATFPCPHCPRLFNRRNMVTRHVNEIHKVALAFECDLCDKTFSVIPSLQKHLMNHHDVDPEPYKCDACHDTFTLQRLLEDHTCTAACTPTTKQKPTKKPPLKPQQKKTTKKKKPVKKIEKPIFSCKTCSRSFRTKSTLKRHTTSHFRCGYCRKATSSRKSLVRHLAGHEDGDNGEKGFVCGCGVAFFIVENLEGHQINCKEGVVGEGVGEVVKEEVEDSVMGEETATIGQGQTIGGVVGVVHQGEEENV